MLPTEETRVGYPTGALGNAATVQHTELLPDGRTAVLLDVTSAHPVDAGWPDQGADRATLTRGGASFPVVDCVVGATDGCALFLGGDIPVGKGTEGWVFVVVHIVESAPGLAPVLAEGEAVEVEVDAPFRARTSAGHTACHLASLALNGAFAQRWKKEVRPDGLGNPDFDGLAIDVSLIRENGSTDTYRLGKSLRRKGFVTEGVVEALDVAQAAVNATLAEWVATEAPVRIDRDGEHLTDRRHWVCELPGHTVRIPCGGTHVLSLAGLGAVRVELSVAEVGGTPVLTMETSVA